MLIKKNKLFLYGSYDKEIEWLNSMSKLGFNFIGKQGFQYTFEKSNLRHIYSKDFLPRSISDDMKSNYIEELKKDNIDFILKKGKWYYFSRNAKFGSYTLHDTKEHNLLFLIRIRNYMICLITALMIFFEITFPMITNTSLQLGYIAIYLLLALFIIINFFSILKKLKEEKSSIE